MSRKRRKHEQALIDFAKVRLPDGLTHLSVSPNGDAIRCTFSGRVLPPWFTQIAHRLGWALVDRDASRPIGRVVAIAKPTQYELWAYAQSEQRN